MAKQGLALVARNVKFLAEEKCLHGGIKPRLATAHRVRLKLRTLILCDYSAPRAKGPGRWHLQVIDQLFRRNRPARGEYVAPGRKLDLKAIACPLYLLAGENDDITAHEQVFAAENLMGTPRNRIRKRIVPGGHVGRFMGARTLKEAWPEIAAWIVKHNA